MTDDTRLTLRRPPAANPVKLVFGERAGLSLSFWRPPVSTPGPVKLTFGDDGSAPPDVPVATLVSEGRITGLRASIALQVGASVQVMGAISGLRGQIAVRALSMLQVSGTLTGLPRLCIAANYDINVQRPTVGSTGARWQDAQPHQVGVRSHYQQTQPLNASTRSHWQDAASIAVQQREHWGDTTHLSHATAILFEQALRLPAREVRSAFQEAQRLRHAASTAFQQALRLPVAPSRQRFQETYRDRQRAVETRFQIADLLQRSVAAGMGVAVPLQRTWGTRYQQAWPPRPGIWTPPVVPGPGPCYVPTLPAVLVFADPFDASLPARLVFICERDDGPGPQPGATVVVPIRRVYVTINNLALLRADTGQPLAAYTLGMSLDVDSWTWQWSATLHPDALPLIVPGADGDPVNVLASVNGVQYRLAVESYSRQRKFGEERIAVSGRGRAALLDAPYAPTLNFGSAVERTARQLAEAALTINGVGIGWDVDWGISDWSVPGDTWTHQGSYISAILDIASAAGGYVQPHNTDALLRILPRYPAAPWNWGALTPDFELPSAVVTVEGIEWQRKAPYDRVFVSGTTDSGVIGQVTRGGTAGGAVAPMVTHPLITHATAARQRGIAELSDAGNQAQINLTLPVLSETGLIKPGALVRYVDGGDTHLGLVRSTSLNWSRPTLRQTLTVETHPA